MNWGCFGLVCVKNEDDLVFPPFITEPSNFFKNRPLFITEPSDVFENRPPFITEPSDFFENRLPFITEPSDFFENQPPFITEPSDFFENRPPFITEPSLFSKFGVILKQFIAFSTSKQSWAGLKNYVNITIMPKPLYEPFSHVWS